MRVSVYVDEPFVESRGKRWAHLTADSAEELHAFAERLGLLRQSFQTTPGKPWKDHYDVTESTRELAIRMGAIDESAGGGVERRRNARRQARERSETRDDRPLRDAASRYPSGKKSRLGPRGATYR